MSTDKILDFSGLGLPAPILKAVSEVGYEAPTSIQAESIPPLLEGRDLLGQAQTGTGKTAAFVLPILSRLDRSVHQPQALVLTPTRELAIQVAEAVKTYARYLKGFHVVPVYGGQSIDTQLRQLRRGVQVVVGTPGRILDHLRRRTLKLDALQTVVLDEADEMLRMGFLDEVEQILEQTPQEKQVALFSATMPGAIRKVTKKYLRDPVEIKIAAKTATVDTVSQCYWRVTGVHKLDALTRILEVEEFDAMLIFVRTKVATVELAEKLEARGFACGPLNGDMNQSLRERTVERLKRGQLDIVVATDVAARGLDVDRISHVVNYDIPYDVEAYVHRIGRTARAGRRGKAILFVSTRERRMLQTIERVTRQRIEPMGLPSREDVADRRINQFKQTITDAIDSRDLDFFERVVESYQEEHDADLSKVAAALAYLVQRERPLMPPRKSREYAPVARERRPAERGGQGERGGRGAGRGRPERPGRERPDRPHWERPEGERPGGERSDRPRRERDKPRYESSERARPERARPDRASREERPLFPGERSRRPAESTAVSARRYRIEVGKNHGVQTGNIVGAISNEAELEGHYIGQIKILDDFSFVDLPAGMPREIFKHLKKVRVCGRPLNISLVEDSSRKPRKTRKAASQDKKMRPLDKKKLKKAKLKRKMKKAKKHRKGTSKPRE